MPTPNSIIHAKKSKHSGKHEYYIFVTIISLLQQQFSVCLNILIIKILKMKTFVAALKYYYNF